MTMRTSAAIPHLMLCMLFLDFILLNLRYLATVPSGRRRCAYSDVAS